MIKKEKMKKLVIVGGEGPGQIAASIFADMNKVRKEWDIQGYLCDVLEIGEMFGKYPILAPSTAVSDFIAKKYHIHYMLHINAKAKKERVDLMKSYHIPDELLATAIHPTAYLMEGSHIGNGSLLAPHAMTSYGVRIGKNSYISGSSFLAHNCVVGDYCTVSAGAIVGSRANICEGAHIGLNACIREDVTVGKYSIIGMGGVVIRNTEPYSIYAGNPAKLIKMLE
jgi:acetyltransferase EpsM